jgi:hypothetical protein
MADLRLEFADLSEPVGIARHPGAATQESVAG